MAYIDERVAAALLCTLLEVDLFPPFSPSISSSSSDEEASSSQALLNGRRPRWLRPMRRSGSYSTRMVRRSKGSIVCHPGSSLVAGDVPKEGKTVKKTLDLFVAARVAG
ncbi:CBS domain-containing protein CBSX5-like [Canna indica]|uniref:CBS domain-containing protein CBSX5-like n=1 Tax=Canna indica TaxID=4628 RepID=A0AAQ3KJH5_9LILI|nr:CBS domain-containing protein CBSX5-like [Canna indica]